MNAESALCIARDGRKRRFISDAAGRVARVLRDLGEKWDPVWGSQRNIREADVALFLDRLLNELDPFDDAPEDRSRQLGRLRVSLRHDTDEEGYLVRRITCWVAVSSIDHVVACSADDSAGIAEQAA